MWQSVLTSECFWVPDDSRSTTTSNRRQQWSSTKKNGLILKKWNKRSRYVHKIINKFTVQNKNTVVKPTLRCSSLNDNDQTHSSLNLSRTTNMWNILLCYHLKPLYLWDYCNCVLLGNNTVFKLQKFFLEKWKII